MHLCSLAAELVVQRATPTLRSTATKPASVVSSASRARTAAKTLLHGLLALHSSDAQRTRWVSAS